METGSEIELKQEEMQEILGEPPHYFLRCGNIIIAIFVVSLLAFSYFIHYPDIVIAPVRITTEHLPVELKAETDGSIAHFFVVNRQKVTSNETIAVLNSPAKWEDVLYISQMLDSINNAYNPEILKNTDDSESDATAENIALRKQFPLEFRHLELGELQEHYNLFLTHYKNYLDYQTQLFDEKEKKMIVKEIALQKQIKQYARVQMACYQQEMKSHLDAYYKDSLLYLQKHLSYSDLEKTKLECIRCRMSIENQKHNIANIELQIIQLQSKLLELEKTITEYSSNYLVNFRNATESLKSEIKKWEKRYLITSPINGIVSLTEFDQENQNINQGDILAVIIPTEEAQVIGKIELASKGAGKVREGQQAYIKLAQFPNVEYGSIPVKIKQISLVPVDKDGCRYYLLKVEIPFPMKTDFGKTIPYMQEMEGEIEIVTQEKRLIEKLFQPLQSLFHNNIKPIASNIETFEK